MGCVRVFCWHQGVTEASAVACREGEEGGSRVSAAWRERWVDWGLCGGLELVGSSTVHLHGLPGKQQTDVPMEVDLPRLRTLEPQMNEVAQSASLAKGLPAGLIVCVTADGHREGSLAQEGLVSSWHGS